MEAFKQSVPLGLASRTGARNGPQTGGIAPRRTLVTSQQAPVFSPHMDANHGVVLVCNCLPHNAKNMRAAMISLSGMHYEHSKIGDKSYRAPQSSLQTKWG